MMEFEEEITQLNAIIAAFTGVCMVKIMQGLRSTKKKRNRQLWQRKWISRRSELGASNSLLREMRLEDPNGFRNHLRMSPEKFDQLLLKVHHNIQRMDTKMRDAIPARTKLEITLRFLATGDSYGSLEALYKVGKSTISQFIKEVCSAIVTALKEFSKMPSRDEWKRIEHGFRTKWNFPGCVGAIDGKHVTLKAPDDTSDYFNYKGTNSIVLLALVDDDYCFSYINVGANGKASDGGIFAKTSLAQALQNDSLGLPNHSVIVGDSAFPLKTYLMKPYARVISHKEKIFNYRLSRARRIVENAFGILVSRFRIFERAIPLPPDKVDLVVQATCHLHNWLQKTTRTYITQNCVDFEDSAIGRIIPGTWREQLQIPLIGLDATMNNHPSRAAIAIRNNYADLFVGAEAVPWQDRMVNIIS